MKWTDKWQTEKAKKIIKCGLAVMIMLVFLGLYYTELKADLKLNGILEISKYTRRYFFLGIISLIITTLAIGLIDTKQKEKLHKKYFIIAMVLGTLYLFLIPLFAQSDEPAHYLRAYEISNGYFTTNYVDGEWKNTFDKSIYDSIYTSDAQREYKTYDDMLNISKIKKNNTEEEYLKISAANYSVVNYIPHILGILVGKVFNLNPYFCGLLGRFFSLVFCVTLVSLGIKLLPEGKFFAFLLLLSPNFLSYASSFSADGTTIAYAFLFMSYILHLILRKKEIKGREYFFLLVLTLCISLAKIVYVPFVLLLLLLPHQCFKNKKHEILMKGALIILGILVNLGWQGLLNSIATVKEIEEGISSSGTNTWILRNPIRYLIVILNTIVQMGYSQLEQIFAGEFLCHWQVRPYALINFGFIIINLFAFLSEEKNKENTIIKTILVLGIFGIIYALVCTAMYQSTSLEYARTINGIQGRYFFPIVIACLFLKVRKPIKVNQDYLAYGILILNFLVALTMINVFVY